MFRKQVTIAAIAGSLIAAAVGTFYLIDGPAPDAELPFDINALPPTAAGFGSGSRAYLDDAPNAFAPSRYPIGFPRIMMTETKDASKDARIYAKYDVWGTKAASAWKTKQIQDINPEVKFHFAFSPRAYQGFNIADQSSLGMGYPFVSAGPKTEGTQVFSGHWTYDAGTRTTEPLDAGETSLTVQDASRLKLKNGSIPVYAVVYTGSAGSFTNPEHVKITAVNLSTNTVTIQRGYKSPARSHASGAIIARHVIGQTTSTENWQWNMSTTCPTDSAGRTAAEAVVHFLENFIDKKGVYPGSNAGYRVDGIYGDADRYFISRADMDTNNDLIKDGGVLTSGEATWGDGLEEYYRLLRQAFPNLTLAGGERLTRGFNDLNGTQMEQFPASGKYEHDAADVNSNTAYYAHDTGNDGLDPMFQRYMIQLMPRGQSKQYVENLSKQANKGEIAAAWNSTKTYSYGRNPPAAGNSAFRLGLGLTLMGDGFYGQENSKSHPDTWYDEYAVDVKAGSPTYGHSPTDVVMNTTAAKLNEVLSKKHWLGQPLGMYYRIYDDTTFAPSKNLVGNGTFESGLNGWTKSGVDWQHSSQSMVGTRSLQVTGHSGSFKKSEAAAKVESAAITLKGGTEYTLSFAAKASEMREIVVKVNNAKAWYLIPTGWTRVVHTFKTTKSGNHKIQFQMGRQDTAVWFDDVYLFEGNANIMRRDFENGIVVVNGTPRQRTIDLGAQFQRIRGTQDPQVNNGAKLSTVTIPAYDAAILVRTEGSEVPEPPDPEPEPPAPQPIAAPGSFRLSS